MKKSKQKFIQSAILSGCAVLLLALGLAFFFHPSIALSKKSVRLEAGETFQAESYIEKVRNIAVEEIEITQNIDSEKPGEYQVIYSHKQVKKSLTVTVSDTVAPKLTPKKWRFGFRRGSNHRRNAC